MITKRKVILEFNPKRLLGIWSGMIDRCHNKKSKHYNNYGGRNKRIYVCKAWKESFAEFAWWALHNGYSDDLTIERTNNNSGYNPRNCRFITLAQQQSNKTTNVKYTISGKTKTISEWSRELGIPMETIRLRFKRGWTGANLTRKYIANPGYQNIYYLKSINRFRVRFQINKKNYDLGKFKSLPKAIMVRDAFIKQAIRG